jgi:hypothetical protein
MFNPHRNKTSNGVLITKGLKVLDYNHNETTVVSDRDTSPYRCCANEETGLSADDEAQIQHTRDNDLVRDNNGQSGTCGPHCMHDHWFETANGGMFNGSRLKAI